MKLIDKNELLEELKKLKQNLSASPIVVIEDVKSLVESLEVKEVKEPNASDRGMAEEIIINLKRVEQDYRIDLTKEIEWLRNKVKKGE